MRSIWLLTSDMVWLWLDHMIKWSICHLLFNGILMLRYMSAFLWRDCEIVAGCLSATVPSAESQQECLACVVSACVPFNFSNNFLRHQFCLAVLSHVAVIVPDLSFFIRFHILSIQVILQCCSLISYPPWLTRLQPSDSFWNKNPKLTLVRVSLSFVIPLPVGTACFDREESLWYDIFCSLAWQEGDYSFTC